MSAPQAHAPLPHELNSHSVNNHKTAAVAGHKTKIHGLNLPSTQSVSLPNSQKQEVLIVPASSTPSFGGFFTVDVKQTGVILNEMYLQLNYSTVVGSSLTGAFIPAHFHITRLEILQNGNVLNSTYGLEQFLLNQILFYDEKRLSLNQASGLYSSVAQRTLLSSQSTTNTFYIPLRTYLTECKISLLNNTDAIQLRFYMDTLANVFVATAGTLTSCTINSANLVMDVTHLDQEETHKRMMDIQQHNAHYIFHSTSYFSAVIASGLTSSTLILASIVGNVAAIFFTLRATTTGVGAWNFTQLASYHLLDAASSSLIGGQPLPAQFLANIYNDQNCLSTYNVETSFGVTDNKANFYCYSFSTDIVHCLSHGTSLGSKRFTGQEQLILNFPSALGANVNLDCYAYVENVLEQGTYSIKKVSM